MAFKNPKELANSFSLNIPTHTPTQEELDNEVREMFDSRPEGLKYIYGNYSEGKDRENALSRLNRVYPENRTTKERFDDYINFGFKGDDIDYYNQEFADIESQLMFENDEERKKWGDMASTWMGEPEWIDLTNKIISRGGKN